MGGNGVQPRGSVTSKVVAILRSFGSGGSLTITEIAQVADLPLSTVHRLVHELAGWGVLRRGDDGRYQIVALPFSYYDGTDCSSDLRAAAAPVVEDLSGQMHSDVRMGLLEGLRVQYAEKAQGCRPFSDFSGATLPAHATALGKALLAFSSQGTVELAIRRGLVRYTSATITTAARLRHVLKVTKLRGMAVARGELLPEHTAVAVPVFGSTGELVAALEVRLHDVPGELTCVGPALMIAARALSRDLRRPVPSCAAAQPAVETRRPDTSLAPPGPTGSVQEIAVRFADRRPGGEQPAVAGSIYREQVAIRED